MRQIARSVACAGLLLGALATPLLAQPTSERALARAQDAAPREENARDWRDPARWRQLRIGMSRFQVLRLLGEPGKVTTYYAFERWEYPDALGHRVNFDAYGRLSVWGPLAR